jgi:hypothetical protein
VATREGDKSEAIKNWVQTVAICLAGVWALYTFIYKESIAPARLPPHLDISAALQKVGRKGPLVSIRASVLMKNNSGTRVYVPASWFKMEVSRVARLERFSDSAYADFVRRSLNEGDWSVPRLYADSQWHEVEAGWILDPRVVPPPWFDPEQQGAREFMLYLPADEFDEVRFQVVFSFSSKEAHPLVYKWGTSKDGSLSVQQYVKLAGFEHDSAQVEDYDPKLNPAHRKLRDQLAFNPQVALLSLWTAP